MPVTVMEAAAIENARRGLPPLEINPFIKQNTKPDGAIRKGLVEYGYVLTAPMEIGIAVMDDNLEMTNELGRRDPIPVDPKLVIPPLHFLPVNVDEWGRTFMVPGHSFARFKSHESVGLPAGYHADVITLPEYAAVGAFTLPLALSPGRPADKIQLTFVNPNPFPVLLYAGEGVALMRIWRQTP